MTEVVKDGVDRGKKLGAEGYQQVLQGFDNAKKCVEDGRSRFEELIKSVYDVVGTTEIQSNTEKHSVSLWLKRNRYIPNMTAAAKARIKTAGKTKAPSRPMLILKYKAIGSGIAKAATLTQR